MKHLFIINPVAGGEDRSAAIRTAVDSVFALRSDRPEYYITKAPLDATEKIRSAAESGEEFRVYACGGDGTFNECVCGAAGLSNVAVCPFPNGTGNDFCRIFGDEGALFKDVRALIDGTVHPIDIIDCNGRYSVNICCVGFDARVGADVHKYSQLPLIGGASGYVVSLVANLFKGLSRNMRITCGDFTANGQHTLVSICNGRYYGGGFNPTRTAMPDDGLLDIFVIKKISLLTLATLIGKYASGRTDEITNPCLSHLQGTEIRIQFDEPNVINIDGEAIYSDDITFKLIHHGVNLIVPAGMTFFDRSNL